MNILDICQVFYSSLALNEMITQPKWIVCVSTFCRNDCLAHILCLVVQWRGLEIVHKEFPSRSCETQFRSELCSFSYFIIK